MEISLVLLTSEKPNKNGFPLVFNFTHKFTRKKRLVTRLFPEQWDYENKMIRNNHPDFDFYYPLLVAQKRIAADLVMRGETNVDLAIRKVCATEAGAIDFFDFCGRYISKMNEMAAAHDKASRFKERNRVIGSVSAYTTAVNQFKKMYPQLAIKDVSYEVLYAFRTEQLLTGNSKATASHYLRSLRALYNIAVKANDLENKRPFDGVFDKLKVKSFQSRKKYLSADGVQALYQAKGLTPGRQLAVDMWLLQFCFGGCDFTDIYFLKKNRFKRGRVYFERGKTDSAIDLKVHPISAAILKKYESPDEYIFPWRKDRKGYETFLARIRKQQIEVQAALNIEVMPQGGNLGPKVSRHTFANLGKQLRIDEDLLRELMGHERDDVDNWYKDVNPESERDAALFKIIDACALGEGLSNKYVIKPR